MSTSAERSGAPLTIVEWLRWRQAEIDLGGASKERGYGNAADLIDALQAQVEVMRAALKKIRDMEPSAIGDSGFVHGPALLLANCKREARAALSPIKPSDADRREVDPHA